MGTATRTAAVILTVLASTLALTGCNAVAPTRDADGRVVATISMPSTEMVVGDCFSFVDGSNHAMASVTPCAEEHSYIVIGQGSLTEQAVTDAGSMQNAVSAACTEPFGTFVATVTEGTKPEQEFIVSKPEDSKATNYSCLATDTAMVDAAPTPPPAG